MSRSINHKEAPVTMSNKNYNLNSVSSDQKKTSTWPALLRLVNLLPEQRGKLIMALVAMLVYAFLTMLGPYIIGTTINKYILHKDYHGVLINCGWLLLIYLFNLGSIYLRTILMGNFGQRLLFTLRNAIFNKLQELPVAFFASNKAGDLISRINNDTDKLNQFFSQSLMQFVSSIFIIAGAGIALVWLNPRLGLATLVPALLMWIYTKLLSPWVKKKNAVSLRATGFMRAEIQESLGNFKAVLPSNRRDYFRHRFETANRHNYKSAVRAGIANSIFTPVYGLLASGGQMVVLLYGVYLVSTGHLGVGFLVSYFMYTSNFYDPLRQIAALWASFQTAIAGWDRISHILSLESDLPTLAVGAAAPLTVAASNGASTLLEFRDVSFQYTEGKDVLRHNSFRMEKGKTYALVRPTGGGKTTTASLIA